MRTDRNRLINADAIEERTLRPVVTLLLAAGVLFLLWGLVSLLPGIGLLIPTTAVSIGTALGAVLTLGLVAALGYIAFRVGPLVSQALSGPEDVVSDLASLPKHLVLFAAVLVAHRGFAPLIRPALDTAELGWTYDLVFLGLALVPTAVVVIRMLGNIGEVAALITDRLTSGPTTGRTERIRSRSNDR